MLTDTLEEVLLSKQHRTVNNYTAAAIYVNKVFQEKPKNRRKLIKRILIALLVFIVVGGEHGLRWLVWLRIRQLHWKR